MVHQWTDQSSVKEESSAIELELQQETGSSIEYSAQEERQAVWRLDVVLIPL